MMTDEAGTRIPFVYAWLTISTLLNIGGMASIVDGFVAWAGFLREVVVLYQEWIRAPMCGAVDLVWPTGWPRISGWMFDWLIMSSGFLLAFNIWYFQRWGTTFSSHAIPRGMYVRDITGDDWLRLQQSKSRLLALMLKRMIVRIARISYAVLLNIVVFVLGPFSILFLAGAEFLDGQEVRELLLYWLFNIGTVGVLISAYVT